MTPEAYCASRAAGPGSTFYYAVRLLPPAKRHAVTALHAFRREVQDAVDEVSEPSVARLKLAWWREELRSVFGGQPQHPVAKALAGVVSRYGLPEADLATVIEGAGMDLEQTRYLDFAALRLYCERGSGVLARMSARIYGYRNPDTLGYADDLGIALELTTIVRDVGEDARRGRIYLPQEDLARFGVRASDLVRGRAGGDFRGLMAFEASRAREWYERALARLPAEDRHAQRAGLAMAAMYRALLDEIERDGYRVLDRRLALTPLRKLWIAWRTARRA